MVLLPPLSWCEDEAHTSAVCCRTCVCDPSLVVMDEPCSRPVSLVLTFCTVESRGPGADAATGARLLPRPPSPFVVYDHEMSN